MKISNIAKFWFSQTMLTMLNFESARIDEKQFSLENSPRESSFWSVELRNGHFHCGTILINFEKSWWWPIKAISHGHISNRHSGSKKVLMATILKHLSTCPSCQHFVNIFQIILSSIVYLFLQIYRGDDL